MREKSPRLAGSLGMSQSMSSEGQQRDQGTTGPYSVAEDVRPMSRMPASFYWEVSKQSKHSPNHTLPQPIETCKSPHRCLKVRHSADNSADPSGGSQQNLRHDNRTHPSPRTPLQSRALSINHCTNGKRR